MKAFTELQLEALLKRLRARSDNAYISYIGKCKTDECLGWEAKVNVGKFGKDELQAHVDAQEQFGRHSAFAEVIEMIKGINHE